MTAHTTLSPWIVRYLNEQRRLGKLSTETARGAGYRLARLDNSFGNRPINQLTRTAIERWLATLADLAVTTRRTNLATIGTFCRWLVRHDVIRHDPTTDITIRKPRAVPRALNADQIAHLTGALPDERAQLIAVLMLHLGLRCCEVATANVEDYDPRTETILVRGKGGHERMLPVPAPATIVLRRYLSGRAGSTGPLIRSRTHPAQGLSANRISMLMAGWMRDAGIKHGRFDGVSAHGLRHTAASDTLDRSGDLVAVQEMLGHASLTTTQIYLRRAGLDRLRAAMNGREYGVIAPLRGPAGAGAVSPVPGRPTEGCPDYPATA
jgi:site-specific recombinase XerD